MMMTKAKIKTARTTKKIFRILEFSKKLWQKPQQVDNLDTIGGEGRDRSGFGRPPFDESLEGGWGSFTLRGRMEIPLWNQNARGSQWPLLHREKTPNLHQECPKNLDLTFKTNTGVKVTLIPMNAVENSSSSIF